MHLGMNTNVLGLNIKTFQFLHRIRKQAKHVLILYILQMNCNVNTTPILNALIRFDPAKIISVTENRTQDTKLSNYLKDSETESYGLLYIELNIVAL